MNTKDPRVAAQGPPEEALASLKKLLLEDELRRLAEVEHQLQCPTPFQDKVEAVLAPAVKSRHSQGTELQQALEGPIEISIQESVKRDPHKLANALFPIMGPAIRQSIRDTFAKMVEGFNQTLDQSLSPQSIRWRIEAKRTGKPFAEVVLAKTLVYQVEQAFLIHNDTSLLLAHAVNPDIESKDADMVSSMFSAIRDFVQDSFEVSDEDRLETMQVGNMNVIVRQGPAALLAITVRGMSTADLRSMLDETLESVHHSFASPLKDFDGDTSSFADVVPLLEDCLETKRGTMTSDESSKPAYHWWALGIASLLLIATGSWLYMRHHHWSEMVKSLDQEPGLSVQQANLGWWHKSVSGLRDPLAASPEQIISKFYNPEKIESSWKAYQSLEDPILEQRMVQITNPPGNTTLRIKSGKLSVEGAAPLEWLEQCKQIARTQAGITETDIDLFPLYLARLKERVESAVILFDVGESILNTKALLILQNLKPDITALFELTASRQKQTRIILTGMTDASGNILMNERLSQERSDAVLEYLQQLNIPSASFQIRQPPQGQTDIHSEGKRCVYFTVSTAAAP